MSLPVSLPGGHSFTIQITGAIIDLLQSVESAGSLKVTETLRSVKTGCFQGCR